MLELLGIVGPPALGKAINSVSGIVDSWGEDQRLRDRQAHEREMASKEAGKAYFESIHKLDDGEETLLSRTMCHIYLLFSYTMASFIVFCCFLQWDMGWGEYLINIKDPEDQGKKISLLGFTYSWGTGKITQLSPLGLAYLGYASLSFIITLTTTNEKKKR